MPTLYWKKTSPTLWVYADVKRYLPRGYVERLPRPDNAKPWHGVVYQHNTNSAEPYTTTRYATIRCSTMEEAQAFVAVTVRMTT